MSTGYWGLHPGEYKRLKVEDIEEFYGWDALLNIVERITDKNEKRQKRNRGFFATTFLTGGRASEVLALTTKNFKFRRNEGLILIRDAPLLKRYRKVYGYKDEDGKSRWVTEPIFAKRRIFPISVDEPLVPFMVEWLRQSGYGRSKEAKLLFPSPVNLGRPLTRIWAYRMIRRLSNKLDDDMKDQLDFFDDAGQETSHLFLHWLRGQRASQLVDDYGFMVVDLIKWFSWRPSSYSIALRYATRGWRGLASKMKRQKMN